MSVNEYNIKDNLQFSQLLKDLLPLKDDKEYVSYNVESFFTIIPPKETIDYVLEQIYVHNKLPIICNKLIFRKLLEKLSRKIYFNQVRSSLNKQMEVQWVAPSLLHYQISGWSKWKPTS